MSSKVRLRVSFIAIMVMIYFGLQAEIYNRNTLLYETITTKNGLSANTANCIVQDNQGFIWIGTDDGLNRYDGYTIVEFDISKYTNSQSRIVKSLCVDKHGILWIGTIGGGLLQYDPTKDKFSVYNTETTLSSLSSNDVFSIIEDSKGNLWAATYGGGLNLVNRIHRNVLFKHFTYEANNKRSICSNNIRCMKEMSNGDIFIGTEDNGISIIHNSTLKQSAEDIYFEKVPMINHRGEPIFGAVMSIEEDKNHQIWIGTWGGGLYQYKLDENGNSYLQRCPYLNLGTIITSLYCDNEGIMWIGTWGNGLYKINNENKCEPYWSKAIDNRISENKIWKIFQDSKKILWICTDEGGVSRFNLSAQKFMTISNSGYNGVILDDSKVQCFTELSETEILIGTRTGGIYKYDLTNKEINKFHSPQNLSILSMLYDNDILWIGTDGDGLIEYNYKTDSYRKFIHHNGDTNSLSNNAVFKIHKDKNGNIWVGTWGGGFSKLNQETDNFENHAISKDNLGQNVVVDIAEDSNGNLWLATFGKGLIKYSPETKKTKSFTHNSATNSISSNTLRQLFVDRFDNVWIGLNGNGLDKFNTKLDSFTHYSDANGFYSRKVEGIEADSLGNIWATTDNGIVKISTDSSQIYNYGLDDGLQDVEYCIGSLMNSHSGLMFAGGNNGMNIFNPYTIQNDTIIPEIVVTNLKINNCQIEVGREQNGIVVLRQAITHTKSIDISYKEKLLTFEFSSLDYTPNNTTRFAYKLDGFDEDWIYTTSENRCAHYSNLSPGEYVFNVIGSNSDDVWNMNGVKIGISIDPPFWMTWWFYIAIAIAVAIVAYMYISIKIRNAKRQQEDLEKEVNIRTQIIESQKSVLEHRLEELCHKNKELEDKNEEIQLQNEVVLTYVQEIDSKREEVMQQKQEIIESIMYARRIQKALFPSKQHLDFVLNDYFIFFKPRDIVSGDYYWIAEKDGRTIIVVADCTGHGVPGAFMSLLGISFLNEIVNRGGSFKANEILNQVRSSVITSLNQTGQEGEAKDGMDMSLCIIDKEEHIIQYAGANNPMYLFRKNGEFSIIKADKMPIGIYLGDEVSFSCQMFEYEPGDTIYMFSDGFCDQFGGEKGKKFKSSRFKTLLASIQGQTMRQQKTTLTKTLNDWMSSSFPEVHNNFQVDDILVVGVKLK